MTWLDVQNMRQLGAPVPSPDGRNVLYTLSTPDWKEARRQTDVYLVSPQQGVVNTKRLTYSAEKNESAPAWTRDGQYFVFLSDRDSTGGSAPRTQGAGQRASTLPTNGPGMPYLPQSVGGGMGGSAYQLYIMRPDGGEARKITDAQGGISAYAFSRDGKWLVYRSGRAGEEQLFALPVAAVESGEKRKSPTFVGCRVICTAFTESPASTAATGSAKSCSWPARPDRYTSHLPSRENSKAPTPAWASVILRASPPSGRMM